MRQTQQVTKEDEIATIQAVLAGNPSAFRSIVVYYQRPVFNIAYRICGTKEVAEEIAQDVFLKVYDSLKTFRNDARLSTWVYRITYNAAISKTRRKEPLWASLEEERDAPDDQAFFGDETPIDAQRHAMLGHAIEMLSTGEQLLIQMHYNQGLGIREIAEVLDISASNVKIRLFRTRKRLFETIEKGLKTQQSQVE